MSAPRLAVIAAELLRDLEEMGFNTEKGAHEFNLVDLVELMGDYYNRLDEAASRAVGRTVRQEALDLN